MNDFLSEVGLILFYSVQPAIVAIMIRDKKTEWFSFQTIFLSIIASVIVPVLSYSMIGEFAHLSMMACCLFVALGIKGKAMD